MKLSVNLQDLLQKNEAAIIAMSNFIAQDMAEVDYGAIDQFTPSS